MAQEDRNQFHDSADNFITGKMNHFLRKLKEYIAEN